MTSRTGSQSANHALRKLLLSACCFVVATTGAAAQTAFGIGALPNMVYSCAAFGFESQFSNQSGMNNSSHGEYSMRNNIAGNDNTGMGYAVLYNNMSNSNSAFGSYALFANVNGLQNNAFGHNALMNNNATANNAFGYNALTANTTGGSNAAFGHHALGANINGSANNAFGESALFSHTSGDNNNAFGAGALAYHVTGQHNNAFGKNALQNHTGSFASAFGGFALVNNTSGANNSAFGYASLGNNTTGGSNVAAGYFALYNNVSGSCHTAVGYNSGPSTGALQNTIAIGCNVPVNGNNTARIGNSSMLSIGGQVGWTTLSDGRFKTDIKANVPGIDFIKKLRPVTYHYDLKAYDTWSGLDESTAPDCYPAARDAKESIVYTGFIAQEVEKAAQELNFDFSGVDKPEGDRTSYGLRYAEFVVPMVQAMQEQQQIIEAQQQRIEAQEKTDREHQQLINSQQQTIKAQAGELADVKSRLERLEYLLSSHEKTGSGATAAGVETPLHVYPNPTDGAVRISMSNESGLPMHFQLTDVDGRTILTRTMSDTAISFSLDLSGYPAGNYMLTATQGAYTLSKVIVFSGR